MSNNYQHSILISDFDISKTHLILPRHKTNHLVMSLFVTSLNNNETWSTRVPTTDENNTIMERPLNDFAPTQTTPIVQG